MSNFKPSDAQQAFFDWVSNSTGNAILEAVAGAGKTTTILNGIELMKGKVWFGVYNKKMAEEIKEKVAGNDVLRNRAFPHESLDTSTFHSLGYGILRFFNGQDVDTQVDDKKVAKIVEATVARKEAEAGKDLHNLRAMAQSIPAVVSMAKNRGFVQTQRAGWLSRHLTDMMNGQAWRDMIEMFDFEDQLAEGTDLSTFIRFAQHVLIRSNNDTHTVDMDDMVYLPLNYNMRVGYRSYDWVLIDEAQDTNPTRRALARKIMRKGARLVAVGDPRQAIFGFTGADNDSLKVIADEFNATTMPLTVTYRCPKAVVAHAQRWVSHITAHESAPEGAVVEASYDDMMKAILETSPATYSETAILCRYNKYLVAACFKLIRSGVPAKIEGRAIGEGLIKLATRWSAVKTLTALDTKLTMFVEREVQKALQKKQEDKADRIIDQVDTLMVIIDRAREKGATHVVELSSMINDMFADNVADKNLITLCSAHKSKGLEWNTVYLLDRDTLMPSKMAKQAWQVEQEINLIYVAVTRAKETLVEVSGATETYDKKSAEEEAA
jgi:DNA helicase-2/ATP-dependent DNA helicase PcrA